MFKQDTNNQIYESALNKTLPVLDLQNLMLQAAEHAYPDLALPKTFTINEIKATSRCSRPMNREGKPSYINLIIEAFKREENSSSLEKVCQEIANKSKKLFYPNETPKVKVFCALVEKKNYKFDQKVKNLHSDYYEFVLNDNYLIILK